MALRHYLFFVCSILTITLSAQSSRLDTSDYWRITTPSSISWDIHAETRLPHRENIEMAGQKVAAIVYYEVDENRQLTITRDVIFPQLRTYNRSDEPEWKKYRAYFRRSMDHQIAPQISCDTQTVVPGPLDSVKIHGQLTFYHAPVEDVKITRMLYPSMEDRFIVEQWIIENTGPQIKALRIANCQLSDQEYGYKGRYSFEVYSDAQTTVNLLPGSVYTFPVYYGATLDGESRKEFDMEAAFQQRRAFLQQIQDKLVFESPDPVLNTLFYFSKIRAAESIFESSMGLVHSPGGGNYYVGIWANDQIEYSGPFFPYLGYPNGQTAAYNAYRWFQKHIPEGGGHIPYAFEVDGNFPMEHLDRGDAAMIAYGTAHFLLASGDTEMAREVWPLVEWSLNYCHKQRNKAGAIRSESDEMEGRIPTGTANLATSSLYYGGLKYGARLARALGLTKKAALYESRQKTMAQVIDDYFGSEFFGLETYKYFEENQHLRHWICLPLSMGITKRKVGTLTALFDKLWTENGILVELNPEEHNPTFWDRATLYALQGAMKVGATDRAYDKLRAFSQKRLLGDHVPYVVEAYPENDMKHLSAESALYCRIITEGLLGMEPLGFHEMQLTPSLPATWDRMALNNVMLFGQATDIHLIRVAERLQLEIRQAGQLVFQDTLQPGSTVNVKLKP